jgi:hypothetical protein
MSKVRLIIGCGLLLVCFCSCRPKDVLSRKEMTNLLYDLHLAEAACSGVAEPVPESWTKGMAPDYFRDMAYQSVLRKHHISEQDFYSSVSWYSRHLRLYSKVYADVRLRMDEFQRKIDLGQFESPLGLEAFGLDPAKVDSIYKWGWFRKDTTVLKGLCIRDSVPGFAAWLAPQYLYSYPKDTAKLELYPQLTVHSLRSLSADSLLADTLLHRGVEKEVHQLQNEILSPDPRRLPFRSPRTLKKNDQIRMRFKPRAREQREMERVEMAKKAAEQAAQRSTAAERAAAERMARERAATLQKEAESHKRK